MNRAAFRRQIHEKSSKNCKDESPSTSSFDISETSISVPYQSCFGRIESTASRSLRSGRDAFRRPNCPTPFLITLPFQSTVYQQFSIAATVSTKLEHPGTGSTKIVLHSGAVPRAHLPAHTQ